MKGRKGKVLKHSMASWAYDEALEGVLSFYTTSYTARKIFYDLRVIHTI